MATSSRYRACGPPAVSRFTWSYLALPPRLRRGGCHFMMLYQLGDVLLWNSKLNFPWARPGSLLPTSWTHASRNAESLIKLARQNHNGRSDGRLDHQFWRLGYRR